MLRVSLSSGLRVLAVSLFFLCVLVEASTAEAQLVVAIEANPGVARPGEQLEVRVTVANQGVADVAGVVLNLLVPSDLDNFLIGVATPAAGGCNQIVNNAACQSGETLIWNLGTIAAGQSVTASLAPIVSATATGPIVFDPVLSAGPSASATVSVDAGLTLDVSLNEAVDAVAPGGELVYTIHFGNRSAVDAAPNALLRLPLPAGTSFVAASDAGALHGGAVEWSLGALAPGQSGTRTVTLTAGAGLVRGASILATAELSDTRPQQAVARALTEIDGLEPLVLAMVVGPDPVAPGEQLEIELTVGNTSASPLSTVTLLLRWPGEIAPLLNGQGTLSPSGCNQIVNNVACTAGEFSLWSLGTLEAGQNLTVSFSAALAAPPDGSIVDFRATVQSSALDDRAEAGRAVAVDASGALDVQVHALRDPVEAGGELAYAIHFGNRSTADAAPNAVLRLTLPADTSFVAASDAGALHGGAVEWSLGTLAPGQSGTRTVTLTSAPGLASGALLEANVALADASAPSQVARAAALSVIDGLEPLVLGMVVGPDPVAPGEQLGIELTVGNTSASPLSTVSLVLRWPHEIAPLLTGQGTLSPVGCNQIVNNAGCTAGEFAVWNLGTLDAGQSLTVSYSAALAATLDGSIVGFEAVVQSAGTDAQARVGRAVAVDATSPLDLQLHPLRDPVAAGDDLAYAIHFGNRSTSGAASNALLRLPLPVGTSFVSASDAGVLNGGAVEWSLGTLAPGQSGTRTLMLATTPGLAPGTLLEANVALADASAPSQRARATALSVIDGLEALALGMVVGPDPVAPGEQLRIELTASNTSASPLSTVSLGLRWPHAIAPLLTGQGTSGPVGCNQIVNNAGCTAGEFAVWNLGTLEAGQSVTVAYSAALAATPDGSIVGFDASVQSAAADAQARVGRAIAVDAERLLELDLAASEDPVVAGDDLVYTLSFVNRTRTDSAPNALLRFPLPEGTTFVSASDAGAVNGGVVEWSLGTLPPVRSGTRSVTVRTEGALTRGALLRAEASLVDSIQPPRLARAQAVTEIDGVDALETTVDATLDFTDWAFQVELTVTNTDVVAHTGVTLSWRVPRDALTFPIASVTGAPTAGCNQVVNNAFCEAGEFLSWNVGTLNAGQSLTVTIPDLYIGVPAAEPAELFALTAIALGSGADDRSVDHVVPEPRTVAALGAGMGLLAALARRRMESRRGGPRGA
ncbi:MAG: PEP-CTERM sorting domain-containing protein [Myxococcota bacterium]